MKKIGIGVVIVFAVLATSGSISKASFLPGWYERVWKGEMMHIAEVGDQELSIFYEQFKIMVRSTSVDLGWIMSSRLENVIHSLDAYQNEEKERLTNTVQFLKDEELIDEFDQYLIESEIEQEFESVLLEVLSTNRDY